MFPSMLSDAFNTTGARMQSFKYNFIQMYLKHHNFLNVVSDIKGIALIAT